MLVTACAIRVCRNATAVATKESSDTCVPKISPAVEQPKSVAGFYCVPSVLSTHPDVVNYKCTFKGADTPMFVKLAFRVKYNLD